jgi:hypothetical protein
MAGSIGMRGVEDLFIMRAFSQLEHFPLSSPIRNCKIYLSVGDTHNRSETMTSKVDIEAVLNSLTLEEKVR